MSNFKLIKSLAITYMAALLLSACNSDDKNATNDKAPDKFDLPIDMKVSNNGSLTGVWVVTRTDKVKTRDDGAWLASNNTTIEKYKSLVLISEQTNGLVAFESCDSMKSEYMISSNGVVYGYGSTDEENLLLTFEDKTSASGGYEETYRQGNIISTNKSVKINAIKISHAEQFEALGTETINLNYLNTNEGLVINEAKTFVINCFNLLEQTVSYDSPDLNDDGESMTKTTTLRLNGLDVRGKAIDKSDLFIQTMIVANKEALAAKNTNSKFNTILRGVFITYTGHDVDSICMPFLDDESMNYVFSPNQSKETKETCMYSTNDKDFFEGVKNLSDESTIEIGNTKASLDIEASNSKNDAAIFDFTVEYK